MITGKTNKGLVEKVRIPGMVQVESVPSGGNIKGISGSSNDTKKSSMSAGFSASRKCGYVNGETKNESKY